jgi:hypothetical protein
LEPLVEVLLSVRLFPWVVAVVPLVQPSRTVVDLVGEAVLAEQMEVPAQAVKVFLEVKEITEVTHKTPAVVAVAQEAQEGIVPVRPAVLAD